MISQRILASSRYYLLSGNTFYNGRRLISAEASSIPSLISLPVGRAKRGKKKPKPIQEAEPSTTKTPCLSAEQVLQGNFQEESRAPSLEDLAPFRPPERIAQLSKATRKYNKLYSTALDSITRAFKLRQLNDMIRAAEPDAAEIRRADAAAARLMSREWGLDPPIVTESTPEAKLNEEVAVSPAHLFIFTQNDPTSLPKLEAQTRNENNMVVVSLTGTATEISAFKRDLAQIRRKARTVDVIPLKSNAVRPELIGPINQMSSAYCHQISSSRIRITALERVQLDRARRLVNRASFEAARLEHCPLLIGLTSPSSGEHDAYGVFPRFSPDPLPWTTGSRGTLRLRKASSAFPLHAPPYNGRPVLFATEGSPVAIQDVFLNAYMRHGYERRMSIRTGHILSPFDSPSALGSFLSPARAQQDVKDLLRKTFYEKPRLFTQSAPPPTTIAQGDLGHNAFLRLVYRTPPRYERAGVTATEVQALVVEFIPSASKGEPAQVRRYRYREWTADVAFPECSHDCNLTVSDKMNVGIEGFPKALKDVLDMLPEGFTSEQGRRHLNTLPYPWTLGENSPFYLDTVSVVTETPESNGTLQYVRQSTFDVDSQVTSTTLLIEAPEATDRSSWSAFVDRGVRLARSSQY